MCVCVCSLVGASPSWLPATHPNSNSLLSLRYNNPQVAQSENKQFIDVIPACVSRLTEKVAFQPVLQSRQPLLANLLLGVWPQVTCSRDAFFKSQTYSTATTGLGSFLLLCLLTFLCGSLYHSCLWPDAFTLLVLSLAHPAPPTSLVTIMVMAIKRTTSSCVVIAIVVNAAVVCFHSVLLILTIKSCTWPSRCPTPAVMVTATILPYS